MNGYFVGERVRNRIGNSCSKVTNYWVDAVRTRNGDYPTHSLRIIRHEEESTEAIFDCTGTVRMERITNTNRGKPPCSEFAKRNRMTNQFNRREMLTVAAGAVFAWNSIAAANEAKLNATIRAGDTCRAVFRRRRTERSRRPLATTRGCSSKRRRTRNSRNRSADASDNSDGVR